ncbi:hypothetical protein AXG93_3802s1030 [Marchantia polymorpha subsp. ruderalis]|uniref:Uncharacterized protein n=1 Tax=Marchantia polymorpha subsp. ruderalis TaxID=1480154 RepID=A0A176VH52_MARPO|nr:hypothetical protein AXG93_3802s1030 [Marchantia polymorpha subsp. ruderalis]
MPPASCLTICSKPNSPYGDLLSSYSMLTSAVAAKALKQPERMLFPGDNALAQSFMNIEQRPIYSDPFEFTHNLKLTSYEAQHLNGALMAPQIATTHARFHYATNITYINLVHFTGGL